MKLSEAIREGAKITPCVEQKSLLYEVIGGVLHTDVCGAAFIAVFGEIPKGIDYVDFKSQLCLKFPILRTEIISPVFKTKQVLWNELDSLLSHPRCNWTREQIADWLEEKEY